ncbi:hypothetical protein [Asanoa iriomotensis]|uniref:hypothetical protein n=1 Tax=Asanoa iriomotensis TaxID=234613 RepID=UPI0019453FEF|nr:hypothetical protein [Asanoa iriomotensis]
MLYVAVSGAVVVVLHPVTTGWACAVITDPSHTHRPGAIADLPDRDVESAVAVELVDPTSSLPADAFARVWLGRVWGETRGGRLFPVARVLVEQVRESGTRTVLLDAAARRRLATVAYLRPQGLDNILARLQRNSFLTPATGPPDLYVLTLPALEISNPCTAESGIGRR